MNPEKPPRRGTYISLQLKLAIVYTLLFSVIFIASFIWFSNYAVSVAEARISASLQNALTAGASRIRGEDVLGLYETAEPVLFSDRGDADPTNDVYYTDDARFWEIAEWLNTVRLVDPNAYPWVFIHSDQPSDPNGFYYVVDGLALTEPLSLDTVNFKERFDVTADDPILRLTETAVYLDDPYEWRETWWVSGYAPVYDAAGNIVAGLGIDYQARYIVDVANEVRSLAIPGFIVSYVVMFVLVYLSSRLLSRPIARLTRIAASIGEGNYDQDFSKARTHRFPDEIDTLSNVFEMMIGKVAQREEKLKQQVADLQIQIDHSKRDEQVQEIVENDFFQSLRSKASEMRTRKQQTRQEAPEAESDAPRQE